MRRLIHVPIVHDLPELYLAYAELSGTPLRTILAGASADLCVAMAVGELALHEMEGKHILPFYYEYINRKIDDVLSGRPVRGGRRRSHGKTGRRKQQKRSINRLYLDSLTGQPTIRNDFEHGRRYSQLYRAAHPWVQRGAQLTKTEHSGLLLLSYVFNHLDVKEQERLRTGSRTDFMDFVQKIIPPERERFYDFLGRMMEGESENNPTGLRDKYIVDTSIDGTLKDGETGLIYIGAAHDFRNRVLRSNREKGLGIGVGTLDVHEEAIDYALDQARRKKLVVSSRLLDLFGRRLGGPH